MAVAKKAVYVCLFHGDEIFAVKNTKGELGVPGGGVEATDTSLRTALHREFEEETGQRLDAALLLNAFSYTNKASGMQITVYYKVLTHDEAEMYVDQKVTDPACDEVEALWTTWRDRLAEFRAYTRSDLEFYATLP